MIQNCFWNLNCLWFCITYDDDDDDEVCVLDQSTIWEMIYEAFKS